MDQHVDGGVGCRSVPVWTGGAKSSECGTEARERCPADTGYGLPGVETLPARHSPHTTELAPVVGTATSSDKRGKGEEEGLHPGRPQVGGTGDGPRATAAQLQATWGWGGGETIVAQSYHPR